MINRPGVTPKWPIVEKEETKEIKDMAFRRIAPEIKRAAVDEAEAWGVPMCSSLLSCATKTELGKRYGVSGTTITKWINERKAKKTAPGEKRAPVEKPAPPGQSVFPAGVSAAALPELPEPARQSRKSVIIDFSLYPELYEALATRAREDFRSPDGEILYLIYTIIEAGKEAA